MKKNKMIVAVIFAFALLTAAFAMSNDGGDEPAKQAQEVKQNAQVENAEHLEQAEDKSYEEKKIEKFILQNVWPDQKKSAELSEEEYNQVRFDYFEKAKDNGEKDRNTVNTYWDFRVNVNKLDELRNLGALLDPQKTAEQDGIYVAALFSQIVIIGTVKDFKYDDRKNARYKTTVEVEIHEVVTGQDLYPELPEKVYVVLESDLRRGHWPSEPNLQKDKKYMLFLTRFPIEFYARLNDGYSKSETGLKEVKPLPDNINDPYMFAPYTYSAIDIEATQKYYKEEFSAKLMKWYETIKKIGELNRKSQFYSRSYR